MRWPGCDGGAREPAPPTSTTPVPPPELRDEFASVDLDSCPRSMSSAVDTVEHSIASLSSDGFPCGEELIGSYTEATRRLGLKVDGYAH